MRRVQAFTFPGFFLALSLFHLFVPAARGQAFTTVTLPLRLVQTIALPDVAGPIGHMSADVDRGRLYVAALGNGTVELLDLKQGQRVAAIANLSQPQGVLYERVSRRLFVASGADGTCKVFDPATSYSLLASIALGGNVSNLQYAPATRQVIVGYGAGAVGAIDTTRLVRDWEVGLSGHPEGFQLELNGSRLFVNIPDAQQIGLVDRATRVMAGSWPLNELAQNYPMALDEANHRLFIGCRRPAMMQVFDTGGVAIAAFGIGDDADDMFFDERHSRIYASCGQGTLDVIAQVTPNAYRLLGALPTAPGARTSLLIPELNRLCLGVPRQGSRPAAIWIYQPVP